MAKKVYGKSYGTTTKKPLSGGAMAKPKKKKKK